MNQALKTVIPIKEKAKEKKRRLVRLVLPFNEAASLLEELKRKHRTARARLLEALLEETVLSYDVITKKLHITADVIKAMMQQGVITVEEVRTYRNPVRTQEMGAYTLTLNAMQQKVVDAVIENARTEKQRSNLNEWFYSSLFPTLEPDGEIHILGTRYNPLDLYEDLIKSKDYVVNTQRAIRVVNGKKVSLWEEKFSLERLEAILKQSGKIIFNMQYQNDTELAKGKIFKAQYFRYYEEYKIDYDFQTAKIRVKTEDGIDQWIKVRLCFGCDLAISEKEQDKGDYFVLMVIGVDVDHNVYVLDYVKERLTFNTQLNTIIDYGRNKFPMVERIGVETVAYQKSLAQELRRLSLLPIININTSKDKVTRAMRRSANFENHKVYFREGMDDLEECLLLFPEVDHDDLFDALDFAMTMADGGNEIRVLKREDFRI